jgi:hypothetical protein
MQNATHPDLGGCIAGCRGADPRSRQSQAVLQRPQPQASSQAPVSASSMILRIVRAHRPHCALQPRQP